MQATILPFRPAQARIAPFAKAGFSSPVTRAAQAPTGGAVLANASNSSEIAGAAGGRHPQDARPLTGEAGRQFLPTDYQDSATPDDAWTVNDPYLARLHREGPHSVATLYRSPLSPKAAREELYWFAGTLAMVLGMAALCLWGRL